MAQGDGRAMKIRSFAKINLGIEVLGKRADGYHEIRTLFQAIDFGDILEFRSAADGRSASAGPTARSPGTRETSFTGRPRLLQQDFPKAGGVEIRVTKNVPAGKGLGGGSSNAAMTLHALNGLWELRAGPEPDCRSRPPARRRCPLFPGRRALPGGGPRGCPHPPARPARLLLRPRPALLPHTDLRHLRPAALDFTSLKKVELTGF